MKTLIKKMVPNAIMDKYHRWHKDQVLRQFEKDPIKLAIKEYKSIFHEAPDLQTPKNLIEKIIWLQFNSDTSLWTLCADKYRVRHYVESKGLASYLPKLYGMWEDAAEIDFDRLPNQFVLKVNNACGGVEVVTDKSQINTEELRQRAAGWLTQIYGRENAQMHYTRIKPCIIAEELLSNADGSSLVDYKIWCFNGKPECILICFDRQVGKGIYSLSMYDTSWNNISERALRTDSPHYGGKDYPPPAHLDEMCAIAAKLSEGFPEVRIDLYNIDGRILIGEMTFTTGYGYMQRSYYEYLGSKVVLPS